MKLPQMGVIKQKSEGVNSFKGYNHGLKISESEFGGMSNMSGYHLPVIARREPRRRVRTLREPGGMLAHEKLCWVDGTGFYWDGIKKGEVSKGRKRLVRMGAYVLIFPDKLIYNSETEELGSIEVHNTAAEVTAALCRITGEVYADYPISLDPPEDPEDGALWMDTKQQPNVLKQYIATMGMWSAIPTVYTKLSGKGIGKGLQADDGITISGFTGNSSLNGDFYVVEATDNMIIIVALIEQAVKQYGAVTVTRTMPDMDFVCESRNRIFGCSSARHEIYASALGNPKNWSMYLGTAGDSYAATVGSTGDFTGCCAHQGSVLFFKENCIHRLSGTMPSNYTLSETDCQGVAKGSEESLCVIDERLFYKSVYNVCCAEYDLPWEIGGALGTERYSEARAGAAEGLYYMSAKCGDGGRKLFVYDKQKGIWLVEDGAEALEFATLGGTLYMLCEDGELWRLRGQASAGGAVAEDETAEDEKDIPWMLETGEMGLDMASNQYISRIQLHAECEVGTAVRVQVLYDGREPWKDAYYFTPTRRTSAVLPITPKRCRTMKLRISGTGEFKLYSIVRQVEQGSDIYR